MNEYTRQLEEGTYVDPSNEYTAELEAGIYDGHPDEHTTELEAHIYSSDARRSSYSELSRRHQEAQGRDESERRGGSFSTPSSPSSPRFSDLLRRHQEGRQQSEEQDMQASSGSNANPNGSNAQHQSWSMHQVAPMDTTSVFNAFGSRHTSDRLLYGLRRVSINGHAILPPISTIKPKFMDEFDNMLETIRYSVLWVDYSGNVRVWDNRRTWTLAFLAAGTETSSAESGSSNFFIAKGLTDNFEKYYTTIYPSTYVPSKYGVRKSKYRIKITDLAIEMALTLKMSVAKIAPHIYGAFLTDFSPSQEGMYAKAVYLMQPGMDLFALMSALVDQSDVSLRGANASWPSQIDTIGARLFALVHNLSLQNVVLTDIRPENIVVMGFDLASPQNSILDLKFIDFEQRYSGMLELADADYDCVFVLNALLFINNVLTESFAHLQSSVASHEMIVRLLDALVGHYRSLMSRLRANPSMQASLCRTVLNVSKASELFDYRREMRLDQLNMHDSTNEQKSKRILERIVSYGHHDQPRSRNGVPSVMNELRVDEIIWRISDQLLEHFDDLKGLTGLGPLRGWN